MTPGMHVSVVKSYEAASDFTSQSLCFTILHTTVPTSKSFRATSLLPTLLAWPTNFDVLFLAAALRRTGPREGRSPRGRLLKGRSAPWQEEQHIYGRAPPRHSDGGTTRKTTCAERFRAPSYELVPRMRPWTSHGGKVANSHAAPCVENKVGRPTPIVAGADLTVRGGCPQKSGTVSARPLPKSGRVSAKTRLDSAISGRLWAKSGRVSPHSDRGSTKSGRVPSTLSVFWPNLDALRRATSTPNILEILNSGHLLKWRKSRSPDILPKLGLLT